MVKKVIQQQVYKILLNHKFTDRTKAASEIADFITSQAAPQAAVWVKGVAKFPVKKHVIAKMWHEIMQRTVVGSASSATGDMVAFDWGTGAICLPIYHEDLNELYWLNESPEQGKEDVWISVEDRLPYKDGDSSIYCMVNDTYDGIIVRPYNEAHGCWDQEDGDDYYTDAKGGKITHWRPLPEPPKK